ncbi:hypothetical protein NPIL_190251 [Nephila pilipes]|uniref:Uncharacterized protein n=1 Tax=Nephila pilipes TaxID=299642 RepID=A0A8X6TX12_NEPPI|nr:hypothetical protein NPIL_190251 [Nephila pilipes]
MEGTMNKNEQEIKHLDMLTCNEISDKRDIPQVLCLSMQTMALQESEEKSAISLQKTDDKDPTYSDLTKFLVLWSLSVNIIPKPLRVYLNTMPNSETFAVTEMINKVVMKFFHFEFEKIIEINAVKIYETSEIECAEFFLSRCLTLCGDPTQCSFMLVASFLSHLILSFFDEMGCFRILYVAEFCFDVLYRRLFWKVFKSKEDYESLLIFCCEFNERLERDTMPNKVCFTCGENWTDRVKDCVDILVDTFYLEESERELFQTFYSIESTLDISSELNEEIIDSLESDPNRFHCVSNCDSECYNYLSYVSQISFPLFKK